MAGSTFLASEQGVSDGYSVAGSVTSAISVFSVDTMGFKRIAVQVTSAGTTCTITYEASANNVNWVGVSGYAPNTPATETVATSTTAVATVFRCDLRYFRARVSTYTSGTVAATANLRLS